MKSFFYTLALVTTLAALCPAQLITSVASQCATSTDGTVVGTPNPLNPPQVSAVYTGTLPAGNYYVVESWYDALSNTTLVGPEVQIQLTGTGEIQEMPPTSGLPNTVSGRNIYISTASGTETLQGSAPVAATYVQSVPLVTGTAVPSVNSTVCQVIANDSGWPTGTGYSVDFTTTAGDTLPGYPMQWQLLGPGNTINLSSGLPLYNGTVTYPSPILASPYNHGLQSISGSLSLNGYNLIGVGSATVCQLNDVLYILPGCFPGTDVGAQINAAYNSLLFTGGRIHVPAGIYSATTPINFTGYAQRAIILEGDGGGSNNAGTTIAFPSLTSGQTAITTGYAGQIGSGIRDLTIVGPTGVGTGLSLGSTSVWGYFLNLQVLNFATGISLATSNTYLSTFVNCRAGLNTVGILNTKATENQRWIGGSIDNNGTGVSVTSAAIGSDLYFDNISLDDNTVNAINNAGSGSNIECDFCHFENASGSTAQYVTQTAGSYKSIGGEMLDDLTTGTVAEFINSSGTAVYVNGTILYSGGQAVTQAANITGGSAYLNFVNYSSITPYNSGYTGFIYDVDAELGIASFNSHLYSELPTCNTLHEGASFPVRDSNTVTWGATIAGSSTNHVNAYCDGTNWTVAAK